jgi:hypothetical protein
MVYTLSGLLAGFAGWLNLAMRSDRTVHKIIMEC